MADQQSEMERALGWVPFAVVQARAKAAMTGRCVCGKKRQPGEVKGGQVVMRIGEREVRGRAWVPCKRCHGTIRQLTDAEVDEHFGS